MSGFAVLSLLAALVACVLGMGVPAMDVKAGSTESVLHERTVGAPQAVISYAAIEELDHWMDNNNPLFFKIEGEHPGKYELASLKAGMPGRLLDEEKKFEDWESVKSLVKYFLFTKYDESADLMGKEFMFDDTLKPEMDLKKLMELGFDPNVPSKIIVHDFGKSVMSHDMVMLRNAFLKKGKFNVFFVDWSGLSKIPDYLTARRSATRVGVNVGKLLDLLKMVHSAETAKKIHVIGAGLGAHVAGIAAKTMTNAPVYRVTGLDPTRILFERTNFHGHLHRSDAQFVDVIHTNSDGLGMREAIGDLDFYPNGGKFQPGCDWDVFGACAHARATQYFIEAIQNEGKFKGALCKDLADAFRGECETVDKKRFAFMGGEINEELPEGVFYLATNEKYPFSL